MDHVRDLMTPQPLVVTPDTPLETCAARMMDFGVRHLPIVSDGLVQGLVEDADIFSMGFGPDIQMVAWDLVRPAVTVPADAPLKQGLRALRGKGVVVVLEGLKVVGVLSEHDVVRWAPAYLGDLPTVGMVASVPVITAMPEMTVKIAMKKMQSRNARHLVVVSSDRVAIGVLSTRDVYKSSIQPDDALFEVSSSVVVTTTRSSSLREAAELMSKERVGCLPILDAGGRPVAIVTRTDVLRAVIEAIDEQSLAEETSASPRA